MTAMVERVLVVDDNAENRLLARATLDDEHALAELGSHAFGDRQAEKSGADDEEVKTCGHRLPRVSDLAAKTRFGGVGWRGRWSNVTPVNHSSHDSVSPL